VPTPQTHRKEQAAATLIKRRALKSPTAEPVLLLVAAWGFMPKQTQQVSTVPLLHVLTTPTRRKKRRAALQTQRAPTQAGTERIPRFLLKRAKLEQQSRTHFRE